MCVFACQFLLIWHTQFKCQGMEGKKHVAALLPNVVCFIPCLHSPTCKVMKNKNFSGQIEDPGCTNDVNGCYIDGSIS